MSLRKAAVVPFALLLLTPLTTGVSPATETFATADGSQLPYLVSHPGVELDGPRTLVLFAHGYTNSMETYRGLLPEVASWGATAAAINYRDNHGIPILWGAQDLIAARDHLHAEYGTFERTIVYGLSMGGAIAGTAIAESDGKFDIWFNVQGAVDHLQLMTVACVAAVAVPIAAAACEHSRIDAGRTDDGRQGPPCSTLECPDAYMRRSPVYRAADMHELRAVYTIHPFFDGLAPYNMALQMHTALGVEGIPSHLTTVLRGAEGTDSDDTPTSHVLGYENDVDALLGLSGHASEEDRQQAVVRTAFEQLRAVVQGAGLPHGPVADYRS